MLNNSIGNVAVGSGRHKKARFNLSHDVNSTYQFGEVQPVLFRDMIANEKDVVDIESMVRMAPMVAPTFGRIKHKEWHHFIPTSDLFPHYGNFLAGTSYSGQSATKLPSMTLGALCHFLLAGSKMTIYYDTNMNRVYPDEPNESDFRLYIQPDVNTTTTDITNVLTYFLAAQGLSSPDLPFKFGTTSSPMWNIQNGNVVDLRYFTSLYNVLTAAHLGHSVSLRQNMWIPTANFDTTSWFDFANKDVHGSAYSYVTDLDPVSLDSADVVLPYVVPRGSDYHECLLAFRLSNFGKRLYKILVGLGYQMDFTSTQHVSLMPLFAFYKAWFDSFGLTRYKSWHDTKCYALLRMFDYAPSNWDFDSVFDSNIGSYIIYSDFVEFITELGNCWYTEDTDFVSAHITDDPISPSSTDMFTGIPDYNKSNTSVGRSNVTITGLGTSSVPAISTSASTSRFSALGVKQLMDMYRWCNRNTVAGRAIEDLLRAQGYGYFLYSCKSNFIGYTEQSVQVYDVVSQSDTFNSTSNDGALLGQYAGRGLGRDKSKTMSFEADEDGYWIGLCAIVPASGYSQGLNPSLLCIDKFTRYNPDLDGKYMTLSSKSVVQGAMPFSNRYQQGRLSASFGFIPIYSGLKVAQNVSNGGFSLRSQRDVFRPYMLDKVIDFGERRITAIGSSSSHRDYEVQRIFEHLPVAGEFWKYVGRYPWLGNLDRIFAHAEVNTDVLNQIAQLNNGLDASYEYSVVSDDNFMIHHVVNQQAYSPMLPIEESFDSGDEDGDFDTSLKFN